MSSSASWAACWAAGSPASWASARARAISRRSFSRSSGRSSCAWSSRRWRRAGLDARGTTAGGGEAVRDAMIIDTQGLAKRYGRTHALTDLTMTVDSGEVFGFLGPNGAGKTTAVKLLLGLARPSGGVG